MEPARVFSYILPHLRSSRCLHVRPVQSRSTRHVRHPRITSTQSRAFSRSTSRSQDLAPPTFSSQDEITRSASTSTTTSPPQRPRAEIAVEERKQKQNELSQKALSQLDKIIADQRARASSGQSSARKNNYDLYGRTGSLFKNAPGTTPPGERKVVPAGQQPFDMRDMISSLTTDTNPRSPDTINLTREQALVLRLKPTLGRTIEVDDTRNITLTRAFQVLETRINKGGNSVRADEREQRFHVRAGQARKIKRRARWRQTFKEGFLGECARVRKMIKQGW